MEVLNNIPVRLDLEAVLERMRVRNRSKDIEKSIQELIEIARPIAKPKAVYEVSFIDNKNEDSVDIGGVRFTSHVLRVNLDKLEVVFPYIVTCGSELEEIKIPAHEILKCYFLDQIKEVIVRSALGYLHDYIIENHAC